MRKNFVKSMAMQVEAQIHEESELWSTSQPFAKLGNRLSSQSEMQGRKLEEKVQQPAFSHGYAKIQRRVVVGLSERQFRTLCEISHTLRNHKRQPKNFAHHAKFHMVCEILLCTDSVRFLSLDILYNFLFSPCNQARYFHIYLFQT